MSRTGRVVLVLLLAAAAAGAVALDVPLVAAALAASSVVLAALVGLRGPGDRGPRTSARDAPAPRTLPRLADVDVATLLDTVNDAVVVLDASMVVIAANAAAGRLLGRDPDEMRRTSLIRAVRDHQLARVAREATGLPVRLDLGEDRVVRAVAVRAGGGSAGDGAHTVLAVHDLSDVRRAQRARSDLIANFSHELRTPVAAARALAETLEEGVEDPEQHARFVARLAREIERLAGMVERLLRLSRLEAQTEEFRLEPLEVPATLALAAERIEPLAERHEVRVVVEGGGAPLPAVAADAERVQELLSNLLDNAVRHSPPGGTVALRAVPDGALVRFEVRDEGPGILPSERTRVFERFYTGDRARTAGGEVPTGTGLGLSIARHIVTRHGGQIWVADTERGTTLCFTLPVATPRG